MTQCLVHFFSDGFNDIHELKYGQAEEKLEAGGDEKLIFNFIWPKLITLNSVNIMMTSISFTL